MLWHIVRFDTAGRDDALRDELIARLSALADLDVVGWLRVARDAEEPDVVGLLVGLADHDALQAYREHPDHQPVVAWLRDQALPAVRLDVVTPDDVASLP